MNERTNGGKKDIVTWIHLIDTVLSEKLLDTKKYILFDSIYIKFKHRQNQSMVREGEDMKGASGVWKMFSILRQIGVNTVKTHTRTQDVNLEDLYIYLI